jgi:hypothetical protein
MYKNKEEAIREQAKKNKKANRGLSRILNSERDLSKLSGDDLVRLLISQPQLGDYADWSKLDGENWMYLLIDQPELSDYADWSKLSGSDWAYLLVNHPRFAEYADWSKLSAADWSYLLNIQPELKKYRNETILASRFTKKERKIQPYEKVGQFLEAREDGGKCPETGCVQPSGGKWVIISNKTGKPWGTENGGEARHYDTKEEAEKILRTYHYTGGFK